MTNPSVFEEALLNLRRGKEHLNALDREFDKFYTRDFYTITCEYNPESSQYIARLKITRPIPQHSWGLQLGDSVHNVRSALDYVAWRLAGSDPADLTTLFPTCRHPAKFKSLGYRVKRIHPDALTEIESMQPYKRPDPVHSSLWLIEELDARDKHKLITMTQSITRLHSFKGTGQITIPYTASSPSITMQYSPNSLMIKWTWKLSLPRA